MSGLAAALERLDWFELERQVKALGASALRQMVSVFLREAVRRHLAISHADEREWTGALDALVPAADDDSTDRLTDDVASRFFTMAGRCSGIPDCCIAAFIDRERGLAGVDDEEKHINYVRCAECVAAGRVATIRRCPSGGWCACSDIKMLLFELPSSAAQIAWMDFVEPLLLEETTMGEGATGIPAGYTNITGLRRVIRSWLRTARAQEDLARVSAKTGTPVRELVVARGGGWWAESTIATRLAVDVSPDAAAFVGRHITELVQAVSERHGITATEFWLRISRGSDPQLEAWVDEEIAEQSPGGRRGSADED